MKVMPGKPWPEFGNMDDLNERIPPGIVAFIQLRKTVAEWERETGEADAAERATLQKVKY